MEVGSGEEVKEEGLGAAMVAEVLGVAMAGGKATAEATEVRADSWEA